MRLVLWLAVWLRRLVILGLLCLIGLAVPIVYTETTCRAPDNGRPVPATLDAAGRAYAELPAYVIARSEEAYAATVATSDPADFAFFPPLKTYWNAACAAVRGAGAEGGLPGSAKLALYGEGAAFTARMAAKAAYEETIGRIATWVRGEERAPLDQLSAEQEAGFAAAVSRGAGSGWDHVGAADALIAARGDSPRDWERMIALNIEYRVRGFFRDVVRFPALPQPPERLRAVVTGIDEEALRAIPSVSVVGPRSEGVQIETAAGAGAVEPLTAIARAGGTITDIAGSGRALVLVDASGPDDLGALVRIDRPGGTTAQILELPVAELSPALLRFAEGPARVERLLGN